MKLAELMESPEMDREAHREAMSFFTSLCRLLKHGGDDVVEELDVGTLVHTNVLPMSTDLQVMILPKTSAARGMLKKKPHGYVMVLYGSVDDIQYMRDVVVHEFIHYLDWKRAKGELKKEGSYFNDDFEMNAFYHNLVERLLNGITAYHDAVDKESARETYRAFQTWNGFDDFWKDAMRKRTNRLFYAGLTDGNKKRIRKRAAQTFQEWEKIFS